MHMHKQWIPDHSFGGGGNGPGTRLVTCMLFPLFNANDMILRYGEIKELFCTASDDNQ